MKASSLAVAAFAFISAATNLTTIDTDGRPQLYVRDLVNGTTRLVKNKDGGLPSCGRVRKARRK